ncbi:MAG: KUP/HAK/KT family potassium transporter [Tepidimonas sp.]|uniref:KUP/HAK/KT family potassium transporter n=1 Tax=Tepidimonas sp. TaxID=2002775 RepID=UPI004054F0A2
MSSRVLCVVATSVFLVVDTLFFTANVVKVFNGGWFPLVIGAVMFTLMTTWQRGRELLAQRLRNEVIDLRPFLDSVFLNTGWSSRAPRSRSDPRGCGIPDCAALTPR